MSAPAEPDSRRVHVYRNLNQPGTTYSIRDPRTGRVTERTNHITITGVTLHVQPAGQARARATGQRNVHAYAAGTPANNAIPGTCPATWTQARYNPFRADTFTEPSGQPVTSAHVGVLDEHGLRLLTDTRPCQTCPMRPECPLP